jgi:hypothetical protein
MSQSDFSQIEDAFKKLPISEKLLLIERLVHRVHEDTLNAKSQLDQQLAQMAADPEIQAELSEIEREFASATADGLESL